MDPMSALTSFMNMGSGYLSAYLNYLNNQNTNSTNVQLTRETNQAQMRLAQEQNEWNLGMWNLQNAYNDPTAQMSRLRAAGVNPALAYANGGMMNEAAPAQEAAGAQLRVPQIEPFYLDPLTMAQVANLNAQTRKTNEETSYQQYINAIEEELSHSPLGTVSVVAPDGSQTVEIRYGNVRAEFERSLLKSIGLENMTSSAELNALIFDLAVLTGSDTFAGSAPFVDESPSSLPGYATASAALVGDQQTKSVAGQLAQLSYEAAQADKAGRQAYAEWLSKHGDEPLVKFLLGLQGFVQTLGISLPSIGSTSTLNETYGRGGTGSSRMVRRWFFGSR